MEQCITQADTSDWRARAACRNTDPDVFFPVGIKGAAEQQIEAAKLICRLCEVQTECLSYALETNQDSGIWGGTSEIERRSIHKASLAQVRNGRAIESL